MGREMDSQKCWLIHNRTWGGVFSAATQRGVGCSGPHRFGASPAESTHPEGRGQAQTVPRDGSGTRPLPSNHRCISCGEHPRSQSHTINHTIIHRHFTRLIRRRYADFGQTGLARPGPPFTLPAGCHPARSPVFLCSRCPLPITQQFL